ncbi:hypothetical protein Pmani_007607 [Petrolisthes manimaculis]|uniref:Beta-lactamase-related domain-containing protein n=1 Tax=Petrolisthes manimaculis TaxID=1843537 RepID=A0AAE1UJX8_9EUCA|nr:hypothetical protein Pmani_007607 [Petrolisthes manimaculis]
MLWKVYKPSLMYRGGQMWLNQCKTNRQSCCVFINYKQLHHEQTPRITHQQVVGVNKLKTACQLTDKKKWKKEHENWNEWKRVSSLVGVFGAALLLSGSSVLCEAPEESSPDQNTTPTTTEDCKKHNEEIGEDTVHRRKRKGSRDPSRKNDDNARHRRQKLKIIIKEGDAEIKRHHRHIGNTIPEGHEEAVRQARKLLRQRMQEAGAPGVVVAVSVDGNTVWSDGFGYADLENNIHCVPETVMRIASISKSLTMAVVAHLWETGKLDLDAPIQKYIPDFPRKTYEGEEVTITTRHLISHKSGIRHYALKDPNKEKGESKMKGKEKDEKEKGESKTKSEGKEGEKDKEEGTKDSGKSAESNITAPSAKGKQSKIKSDGEDDVNPSINQDKTTTEQQDEKKKKKKALETSNEKTKVNGAEEKRKEINEVLISQVNKRKKKNNKKKKEEEEEDEFDMEEYYIKEEFESIKEALELFQNDDLFFKPGTRYMYTTHGWTVVSAVVEAVVGKPFTYVAAKLFWDLGLDHTYLDKNDPIIYNRASYYVRDKRGRLKNAPYVDNSYKWAGGGFLSTVGDLCKFGNAMLYASQHTGGSGLPGCLKASTVRQLWTPVEGTIKSWHPNGGYGMGWSASKGGATSGFCRDHKTSASHSGGAVGASSVLLILPDEGTMETEVSKGKAENKEVTQDVGTDSKKNNKGSDGTTDINEKDAGKTTVGSESDLASIKRDDDDVTRGTRVDHPPKGVVVALITNMQGVGLHQVATQVAHLFQDVYTKKEGRGNSKPIFSS